MKIAQYHPNYRSNMQYITPGIHPVVLEFRKLTTQISISNICSILFQPHEGLTAERLVNGGTVPVDESFQSVIVALKTSKVRVLIERPQSAATWFCLSFFVRPLMVLESDARERFINLLD
jgi:hypothetical protein